MTGHALLFTDLVDSTAVVERLGDARAAIVLAEHDRGAAPSSPATAAARSTTATASSCCSPTRSRPRRSRLAYHEALAALGLSARAGLHSAR